MIKLFRPVKGARWVDRRMTQAFWLRPEVYWPMGFKGHMWLDYAWPVPWSKVPIYSATDWIATIWRDPKGYGNFIKVQYENYTILYWHLDSIQVKNWPVKAMERLGIMWTTWFSSWVHLHFEIKDPMQMNNWYKWRIDPAPFITDRPTEEVDQDIQALINDWIRNGVEWDWMTKRIWKVVWKLYNKLN